MSAYSQKVKFLLPSLIILGLIVIIGYVVFYGYVQQRESYMEFSIFHILMPMVLPILPIIVFSVLRLKKLQMKKANGYIFFALVCWICLTPMLITAANYSKYLFGRNTTVVNNQRAIDTTFQFYTFKDYRLDSKSGAYSYQIKETESRNSGRTIAIELELVAPILIKGNRGGGPELNVWATMECLNSWKVNLSNNQEVIKQNIENFIAEKTGAFYNGYLTFGINHFEKVQDGHIKELAIGAIKNMQPQLAGNKIMLLTPIMETIPQKTSYYLYWLLGTFFGGIGLFCLALLIPAHINKA